MGRVSYKQGACFRSVFHWPLLGSLVVLLSSSTV